MKLCSPSSGCRPAPLRPLSSAERLLAASCTTLARALAQRWSRHNPILAHEFESAALLAVVAAAARWESGRHVLFRTFARHKIEGALRSALAADYRRQARDSRTMAQRDLGAAAPSLRKGDPGLALLADREEVACRLALLPPSYSVVIRLVYFDGLSLSQAARSLGKARSTVEDSHRRAMELLRGYLGGPQP